MQLVSVPTVGYWPSVIWIDYVPKVYKGFTAPMESERHTLGASIAAKEAQVKRWIDHTCKVYNRTLQIIVVRTLEEQKPVKGGRVSSAMAYEIWERVAMYAGCPIKPHTTSNLQTPETELIMESMYWKDFHAPRKQCCRLGILHGFHSPNPRLDGQLIVRDNETTAMIRMEALKGRLQGMVDAYNEKPLDDDFVDAVLMTTTAVVIDPVLKEKYGQDVEKWAKIMLNIASTASQHVQGKKERALQDIKKVQNELHKKRS